MASTKSTAASSSNMDPPLCCKTADILINEGKVSFGHGCIVHPKAKIIIEGDCSIIFGEYNIIEENVVIKATPRFNPLINNNETITVYIGCYNHFKVGSYLENTSVENYNIFDYKCILEDSYVESKSIITPGIVIPKRTTVKSNSIVLDNQIIIGNSNFDEAEFIKTIKEMYKLLAFLLPKQNQMHNIN
jgi:carbonic anhydrase/acetyltransferase-like protein (isoleucine patch superfamily)